MADDRLRATGHDADGRSAGQLMKEVTEDLSTLVRKEIELAKQELGAAVAAKVKGALGLAIAGVLGFFALIFVLLAVRDGLAELLWTWLADLVTAALLLALGAGGGAFAKRKLATPISAEMTQRSLRENVDLARSVIKR